MAYSTVQLGVKYAMHVLSSVNQHGVHSPFLFNLLTEAVYPRKNFSCFNTIEQLRKELLVNTRTISITDLGAGSRKQNSNSKEVRTIAKNALKPPYLAQLLFNIVAYSGGPKTIIELGTSLGITTAYLANTHSKSMVYTFEGCPNTLAVAQENWAKLNLTNIHAHQGDFKQTLPIVLQTLQNVDVAYIDGNHQYKPTLDYFNAIVERCNNDSILIFDDIHWSKEMEQAWSEIYADSRVTVSFDLFFFGIVFLRKEQPKQHFKIRFFPY